MGWPTSLMLWQTSSDTVLFSVFSSSGWLIFLTRQLYFYQQSDRENQWSFVNLVLHLISIIAVIVNMSVACCCDEPSLPELGIQALLANQRPVPTQQVNPPAPVCWAISESMWPEILHTSYLLMLVYYKVVCIWMFYLFLIERVGLLYLQWNYVKLEVRLSPFMDFSLAPTIIFY